jgi:hypothetical protein
VTECLSRLPTVVLGTRCPGAYRILLFDVDGTLVSTGGAGAAAWKRAFEELHGIPADIGE